MPCKGKLWELKYATEMPLGLSGEIPAGLGSPSFRFSLPCPTSSTSWGTPRGHLEIPPACGQIGLVPPNYSFIPFGMSEESGVLRPGLSLPLSQNILHDAFNSPAVCLEEQTVCFLGSVTLDGGEKQM